MGYMSKTINVLNELLVDIFNEILAIEEKALRSGDFTDLSMTEIHTLEAIGISESRSMSEIASDLDITVGTLTIAINNLVKKGYVERRKADNDRRLVLINLTKKGKSVYEIHSRFHQDMVKAITHGITEDEEYVFVKALEKISTFFKENYDLSVNKKE